MKKRIAIYGGGFNPPHLGHVMAAVYAKVVGDFDRILVMPCWEHAFQKNGNLIEFNHRAAMCELAFDEFNFPYVRVHRGEKAYQTRYTVDLIEEFRRNTFLEDKVELTLIIGSDSYKTRNLWHRWNDLKEMVELFVVPRGEELGRVFGIPDISSTDVRRYLGNQESHFAAQMIPPEVLRYIRDNKLYGLPSSPLE